MKKIITLLLVVVLTASAAIGLTLAYLTDTDEDVNVMTLGNVYIEQNEQERDETGNLVDFVDNKPFFPAVYPDDFPFHTPTVELPGTGCQMWDSTLLENAHDKIVTVTNTGKSDAYVRTWFAFENGETEVYYNTNKVDWTWSRVMQDIPVAGSSYDMYVATYNKPLRPGETTPPSLLQFALNRYANNAEVNSFGDTYEILAFSQAVQTQGFDDPEQALTAAFGQVITEPKAKNNPWTGLTGIATSAASLKEALAGGGNIIVGSDITVSDDAASAKNVITKDTTINFADSVITLDIPNATGNTANWVGVNVEGGTVVFEGTTGGVRTADNGELYAVVLRGGADLTINGGEYIGGTSAISITEGTLTINGGYFAAQEPNTTFTVNCVDDAYRSGTAQVVIQGGSFLNWNPADNSAEGAHTNFVPVGYKVVESQVDGGTLYTVVSE